MTKQCLNPSPETRVERRGRGCGTDGSVDVAWSWSEGQFSTLTQT